jgi:hypothetical protein
MAEWLSAALCSGGETEVGGDGDELWIFILLLIKVLPLLAYQRDFNGDESSLMEDLL